MAVPAVSEHLRRIREVWKNVRAALNHSSQRNQHLADFHRSPAPEYRPGHQVWLSSHDLPLQTGSHKLSPRFIGLFETDRIINPTAVRLKLPASLNIHPTFHVSLLKPVSSSALSPLAEPPPPPWLIDNHPAFTISKIFDVRDRGRGFQCLVDWEGYGLEERSWIPRRLILDNTLIRDFYKELPHKPGRPPGGAR